jgi:hypothetical protein
VFTLNNPKLEPKDFLEKAKFYKDLRFIVFQYEVGKTRNVKHFQGYLELKTHKSFKKLNEELFENLAHLESRRGSQSEAINYCTDKTKQLVTKETFEWGNKKIDYSTFNKENSEIPENKEEQWIFIENKIISKKYKSLNDIHDDFPYLVIHHSNKLQELLNKYNPIDFFNLIPAKVIWLYGESGAGKSCYTDQLLEEKNYKNEDLTFLKSDKETILWFNLSDENKKVLIVEELRSEWPKYNSLINWIDKKTFLPVKGALIRNNYELIIINSLKSPFEIYSNLPSEHIIEPLRRIYNGEVLLIEKNEKLHRKLLKDLKKKKINEVDFKFKLIPKITNKTKELPDVLKKS